MSYIAIRNDNEDGFNSITLVTIAPTQQMAEIAIALDMDKVIADHDWDDDPEHGTETCRMESGVSFWESYSLIDQYDYAIVTESDALIQSPVFATEHEAFAYYRDSYMHDYDEQRDIVESVISGLDNVLRSLGAHQTTDSTYSYGVQCHGLEAEIDVDWLCDYEPTIVDEDNGEGYDATLSLVANRWHDKLVALRQTIEETPDGDEVALDDAIADYEYAINDMLDDICSKAERLIDGEMERYSSEETFEEWVWEVHGEEILANEGEIA